MMQVDIFSVNHEDYEKWLVYWLAYQEFYQTQLDAEITQLTWQRFFDSDDPVFCAVAKIDQEIVGFVTYILHRSTWARSYYCYLEDLYVDQHYRGQGIASQLIYYVQQQAKLLGCERLYWHTHQDNLIAQRVYDHLANKSGMIEYRMLI